MGKRSGVDRLQLLSRIGAIGILGGLAAGCSTDASRMAGNPFSNPFGSEPSMTGSLPERPVAKAPTTAVQAQALPAPQTTPRAPASVATNQPASAPAPVTQTGAGGWTAAGGTPVTVGAGESLATIATRYGIPERALLSANGLTSAAQVTAGQQIVIPTYSATAQQAAAPAQTPTQHRPAAVAQTPRPAGQPKLQFVEGPKPAVKPEAKSAKIEAKAEPKKHLRPGQITAQVGKPDAKPMVAQAVKPEAKAAAKPEAKDPKAHVRPGQQTAAKVAPAAPKAVAQAPAKPEKVARIEAQPVKPVEAAKPAPQKVAALPAKPEPAKPAPAPAPKQETAAAPAKEPSETGAVPQNPSADFRWPARGRVITGYSGGGGNEGINIAVPEGTPVKAAEGGTVAYAGEEVKGYGKLVLIRHDNGYVSAYAHNGELNVKRGDKVKRGQVVAKSGQSGNVTSPQLHFEIRKGSTPVDPVPYLTN